MSTMTKFNSLNLLVAKSVETLVEILDNKNISTSEKSEIALKILQIANSHDISIQKNEKSLLLALEQAKDTTESLVIKTPQKETLSSNNSNFFSSRYLQLDNFLSSTECQEVLHSAFKNKDFFVPSTTTTNQENYRQSLVLYKKFFQEIYLLVKKKIDNIAPFMIKQLSDSEFSISQVEMQMTAHNDGCFYKIHTDAGSEKNKTRELTYVYYFYQEPKSFNGGELKIYDTAICNNSFIQQEKSKIVEPRNNSIVFFNSHCKHEVLPISCKSQDFRDSRFTLNGWIRR